MKTRRKAVLAVAAGALSVLMLGSAAFAAFPAGDLTPSWNDPGKGDRIAEVLEKLVTAGTITAAQKTAIVDALKTNDPVNKPARPDLKGVAGDLVGEAATYLGMDQKAVAEALRTGKSLGEIAAATAGKSRQGLIDALVAASNARIAKAEAEGKITAEQAARLRTGVAQHVGQLVDRKHTAAAPRKPQSPQQKNAAPAVKTFVGSAVDVASTYLGMDERALMARVRSGNQTLGEIAAQTPGKSRQGLVDAIVAAATAKIDAAVTAGKLTADQAAALKAQLPTAAAQVVDAKPPQKNAAPPVKKPGSN